ncbi:MAG TPA: DUF3108 domain-containing protein [Pyrinomonadaceae bacterium]
MLFLTASAQEKNRALTAAALPFEPSEELVYEGEFSRALLRGINVAELRFNASRAPGPAASRAANGETPSTLRFTLDAVSKGLVSKIFGLTFRQRVESTVEPASFGVMQTSKLDEQGKRRRTSLALFDRAAGKVVWTERDPNDPTREPRVVSSDFGGAVQDIASAFYFLRTQPLAPGRSFEIPISDSGRVYRVPIRVGERKRLKTVLGQVFALRIEAEVFGEERLLRGKGTLSIWLTDDERRVPVRAQIINELGTVDLKLKRIAGPFVTAGRK